MSRYAQFEITIAPISHTATRDFSKQNRLLRILSPVRRAVECQANRNAVAANMTQANGAW